MRITKKLNDDKTFDKLQSQVTYKLEKYGLNDGFKSRDAIEKLGQLEELEEELGIDLVTLFEVLKRKSFYVKEAYCVGAGEIQEIELNVCWDINIVYLRDEVDDDSNAYKNKWCIAFEYNVAGGYYDYEAYLIKIEDYGKTWALTLEELEDGKV